MGFWSISTVSRGTLLTGNMLGRDNQNERLDFECPQSLHRAVKTIEKDLTVLSDQNLQIVILLSAMKSSAYDRIKGFLNIDIVHSASLKKWE